jgi:cytochrome c nitrite reductase small subunit
MSRTFKVTVASAVAVGGVVLVGIATSLTDHPEFCAGCHTIAPAYESWAKSSHKEVACVACHVKPGVEGWLHDKVWAGIKDTTIYTLGTPTAAYNLKAHVDSDVCLSCHRHILRVSEIASRDLPSPVNEVGLIMNHRQHMQAFMTRGQGEGCTTCHSGVVHDEPIKDYPIVIPRGHVSADSQPWHPVHPEGSYLRERALRDCFGCHDGKEQYSGRVLDRKCETCHIPEQITGALLFN